MLGKQSASEGTRTVLVQDRSRLFADSLKVVCDHDSAVHVIGHVDDDRALEAWLRSGTVDVVVLEVSGVPWDVGALLRRLRKRTSVLQLVGTHPAQHRNHIDTGVTRLSRTSSGRDFSMALQGKNPKERRALFADDVDDVPSPQMLTKRELQVLALMTTGLTTAAIGQRLGISPKTVENRRQALYAKLEVQNQSHAIVAATRAGLLSASLSGRG